MSLLWVTLPIVFLPLLALTVILVIMYKNRALSKIPGPPPVPFFGNKTPTNVQEIFELIRDNIQRYGETSRLYLGPIIRVLTCEVEVLEYIMKSNVDLKKSMLYDLGKEWIGEGLLTIKGDTWRRRRKLLTPTFHFGILNDFLVTMNKASGLFVKKLAEQSGNSSINILQFTQQYSLDIIGETSMNVKLKNLENGNTSYMEACNNFLELNMERSFTFWKNIPFLYKMFAKDSKLMEESVNVLHSQSRSIIEDRYKLENSANRATNNSHDDFGAKRKQALIDTLFQNKIKANLSDQDIQAEVDTFMFEGFDTVSRALAFGLYDLGQNPAVQNRLYEEITSTFGDDVDNLTQKQINELSYLDMVVKEILRLHNSVPFIERELESDATIGGRYFPKGTVFMMLIHWLNRNPKYYPEPEKFDPERFSPENSQRIPNFAYVPFSAGPRNCIGQKFALMELKLAIIHVVKDLEILPVPGHKLNLVFSGLLDSTTGILIRVKNRN